MSNEIVHQPVLSKEVLHHLKPKLGHWYLDGTLGDGGHTILILKTKAKVLAFDQDEVAIERAKQNIIAACPGVKICLYENQPINVSDYDCILVNQNFSTLDQVLPNLIGINLNGALFDLGISSYQLLTPERGFSFQYDAPLDMRMDRRLGVTAADLLNALAEKQLIQVFRDYADETYAPKIAKAIVLSRQTRPFTSTTQLANLITQLKPKSSIHPATKVFQALRIAVNLELHSLTQLLPQVVNALEVGSPLVVISFHSGEDRIVKHFFKDNLNLEIVNKDLITASPEENKQNPKATSAKMRVARKI